MNTANNLEFAEMPSLIVALDTVSIDNALQVVDELNNSEFGEAKQIGYKIARWHDQSTVLRGQLLESGLFTVLDTQLDDGIDEMSQGITSLLSVRDKMGRLLLPNAITMSRAKETVRGRKEEVQEKIFKVAHTQDTPVMVISHIDQTRMMPSETTLQEIDSTDSFSETRVPFDAIELHADTVLSDYFKKERQRATDECRDIPLFLASRLSYGQRPDDNEAVINRSAHLFRRGVKSIYLGKSIMQTTLKLELIERIIESNHNALSIEDDQEFIKKYPLLDSRTHIAYKPALDT